MANILSPILTQNQSCTADRRLETLALDMKREECLEARNEEREASSDAGSSWRGWASQKSLLTPIFQTYSPYRYCRHRSSGRLAALRRLFSPKWPLAPFSSRSIGNSRVLTFPLSPAVSAASAAAEC